MDDVSEAGSGDGHVSGILAGCRIRGWHAQLLIITEHGARQVTCEIGRSHGMAALVGSVLQEWAERSSAVTIAVRGAGRVAQLRCGDTRLTVHDVTAVLHHRP